METVSLLSLWMPIVLSTVVIFFASFIAWMVLPHHKSDWKRLPDENAARTALHGVPPGEYTIPHAAGKEDWQSDAWKEKANAGPNGFLSITPNGPPNLGKSLLQWTLYCLAISICVAYVLTLALGPGAEYRAVFRIASTVAFLAYAAAHVAGAIWMGHAWSRAFKDLIDGLVYGLLTGGVFGWLWP